MTEAMLAPNMPKWMRDHVDLYTKSGGTEGHMYTINLPNAPARAVPSLLLTTTGRKSGQRYVFPLFYGRAGDSYFVVASKGGAPEHPEWYFNFLEHPEVELQDGPEPHTYRARVVGGEERAIWWERAVAQYAPYADYQEKTDREIPVFVLERV